jgi:hypothetical protein
VSRIAYHVKVLLRAGLIQEAGRRRVRGTIAHLYRATASDAKQLDDPRGAFDVEPEALEEVDVGELLRMLAATLAGVRGAAAGVAEIQGGDGLPRLRDAGPQGMRNACDRIEETVREELAAARRRVER